MASAYSMYHFQNKYQGRVS